MRILLSNDDGIHAPGLKVLEAIARQLSDDVWICAPHEEMSGAGHSLTLNRPVRLIRHDDRRYSVSGTPTDAVMFAIGELMPDKRPDLILSGVNRGANLGDDVTYSGTVSAAMEGTLAGIRSIALSQVYRRTDAGTDVSFDAAEKWGAKVVKPLLDMDFGERTLINVNFPPVSADAVKGVRVVRQGFHDYGRVNIVKGTDPRGFHYYWFGLHGIKHVPGSESDLEAVAEDMIAITPLQLDLTNQAMMERLGRCYNLFD